MSTIREVASEIAKRYTREGTGYADRLYQLTYAIDEALSGRDERAAKVAEAEHAKLYPGVDYGDEDDSPAFRIARTIREGKPQ